MSNNHQSPTGEPISLAKIEEILLEYWGIKYGYHQAAAAIYLTVKGEQSESAGVWVKASERKPAKHGWYHTKVNGNPSVSRFTGYHFRNEGDYKIDMDVLWLDESAASNQAEGEGTIEIEKVYARYYPSDYDHFYDYLLSSGFTHLVLPKPKEINIKPLTREGG